MPVVVHEPAAVVEACDRARSAGERVGLVPTMGALHEGHLALIDEARRRGAGYVVVTIFVNPLQFGPTEDFDRYPRTLDADVARCAERGVSLVYAPDVRTMHPAGFQTHVVVEGLTARLEGAHRPGHFRGVTTVVTKLFQVAQPCLAVFGRKDYQQWKTLERMARDLDMRVTLIGHPTVREPDGLALSSRNRYLGPAERARALAIVRGLRAAADAFAAGERDTRVLEALVRTPVTEAFDRVDYVAVTDPETLEPSGERTGNRALVAVAAHIGTTRLIDNCVLGEDTPPTVP
jgi:pantoate--beta-alanine ligase